MDNTKTCTRCKKEFPATKEYFTRDAKGKFELASKCKACFKEIWQENKDKYNAKQRDTYHKNKEKYRKIQKRYYENNKEDIKEWNRKFRQENKEYYREYHAKYREEHKDELNKKSSEWRKNNKERRRFHYHTRRSLEKSLPAHFTTKEWEECKRHFDNKCAYCGSEKPLEQDHFIPVVSGGEYTKNNIIPSCRLCNSRKSSQDFFEWYPMQECYSKQREQKILKYLNYKEDKTQQLALL